MPDNKGTAQQQAQEWVNKAKQAAKDNAAKGGRAESDHRHRMGK